MTVNFVFDKLDPAGSPISNLTSLYYNKDKNEAPYWVEWGNDINTHLLTDSKWLRPHYNLTLELGLTADDWDLCARCKVLKDTQYLITADIKLGTADNCNISVLDSEIWEPLGAVSFNVIDHQLSRSDWTTVTVEILPSQTGTIHLHIGALDDRFAKQKPGTVFIKNLRLKSNTDETLIDFFSQKNGHYRVLENNSYILLSDLDKYKNDLNIYPIVITTAEHRWCWPLLVLGKNIVDLVNTDRLKILFLCSFEIIKDPFLSIHHQVTEICKLNKITKVDNIIFASSDSSIERRLLEYTIDISKTHPQEPLVKFKDINAYGHVVPKILKSLNHVDWLETYCNTYHNKPNLFLYLNNRVSYHRYLLYKYMEYKNLLKHGMYSWSGWNLHPDYDPFSGFLHHVSHHSPYAEQKFIDYVRASPDIQPAKIADDSVNLLHDPLRQGSHLPQNWIADTYFSVVTETHSGDDPSHITEKIYKLIFCCHPFIVIGPRYHLATLHRYGFKTFPEMFDESYDSMLDIPEKYNLVSDQIKYYTTEKGKKRLIKLLPTLRSTLEYNRNHLLSLSSNDVWNSLENLYKNN